MAKSSQRRGPPPRPPVTPIASTPGGRQASRPWLLATLGLAALAAAALAARSTGRRAIARDPGLSVLLITVDTLRADALGAYGHRTVATPWMDRLAAGGVRFADAHAHNVVTLPSHANILSGRYPVEHGIRDNAGFRFPGGVETLATMLKARGWRTGAFVSAFVLDSRFGLDRGFDLYDDRLGDRATNTAFLVQERPAARTVEAARRWLDAQGGARTFCWVHVYEPHFPYAPPEPFASQHPGDPYHGEVAATDAALAPLLDPLLPSDRAGRTLVVLTSDHGESLGEHAEMTHGIFAYEGTLRVPLVLYQPSLWPPRVVETPVRHVDLLPTVLDALGIPTPDGLPGRSLLAAAAGGSGDPEPGTYFESLSASLNRGWAPLHGVLSDGHKYIDLPLPELYDLRGDPREARNLAASQPQRLERMRALLGKMRVGDAGTGRTQESAEVRDRLRALGYVMSGATAGKQHYTEEDDPKRLIGLDAAIQDVVGRYTAGDLQGALAASRALVRRRSDMPLALVHLAFLERETGDLTAAVAAGRRALALRPDDSEVAALLGAYLNESGRSGEALALLEPFAVLKDPDLDVLIAEGVALSNLGRPREALAAFESVRRIDPSNAMAQVNIGTVHLLAGDSVRARAAFAAALELDASLARAHNSLGVIAAKAGQTEEAIAHWRQAAALDPRDYQTLYNLGHMLVRLGRPAEARPYLEAYVRAAPAALEAGEIARVRAWLHQPGR